MKFTWIIGLLIGLATLVTAQDNLKIEGQLLNTTTHTHVQLLDMAARGLVVSESSISTEGKFTLLAEIKEAGIYSLQFDAKNKLYLVLHPGENILFEGIANPNLKKIKISGSPDSEMALEMGNSLGKYELQIDSLNRVYKSAQANGNVAQVTPAIKKTHGEIMKQRSQEIAHFVKKHPASLASLLFLQNLEMGEYFSLYKKVDAKLYQKYPANPFVVDLHKRVAAEMKLAVGSVAPEIILPGTDGAEEKLSALRGNVVLIDFWASWCGPCRKENPHVVRLYQKYNNKGFEVFSVSLDKSRDAWLKAIADDQLDWTHVSDLKYWKSAAAKQYGVTSIPFTVLIDKQGKIIAKGLRGAALERKLAELLD